MTRPLPVRAAFAVLVAALAAYWAWRLVAFARVLPGHDFVGDTYWVDYYWRELGAGRFPSWAEEDGLGHPTTIQRGSILLFLPVVALKAIVSDTVVAAKLWYALLHTLSFVTFLGLARRYGASRPGAIIGAFAYLLAPLHTNEFAWGGHWQLAVSFFLAPWILSSMLALVREPRARPAARVALLLAWAVLSDNERTVTLLPVYAGACALELWSLGRAGFARRLGALGLAALLGVAVTAWLTVPLVLERASLNLLSPTEGFQLFHDERMRQLRGPLFLLDQGSFVGADPGARAANEFGVHAGFLLVGLGALAVLLATLRRERVALLGYVALVSIWIATWDRAWCVELASRGCFALLVVAVAALGAWRRAWSVRAAAIGALALTILACVPSAGLLARAPPFSMLGNKLWFLTVALSLVLAVLVAKVTSDSASWVPLRRALFGVVALALAACDAVTWIPNQTWLPPDLEARLADAFAPLAADRDACRYLPYPYQETDAVDAFALRIAPKPSASSWLLWAGGRWGVQRIATAYAELGALERLAPEAAAHALDRLAAINVKYLVVPGSGRRVAELEASGLLRRVGEGEPAILRNTRWTGDASVTAAGVPVAYRRPSAERWELEPTTRVAHVLAEAWYPYWRYALGGVSRATRPSADGLIELDVDADGPVTVTYERPAVYRVLPWVSGAALLVALWLLTVARGARRV